MAVASWADWRGSFSEPWVLSGFALGSFASQK